MKRFQIQFVLAASLLVAPAIFGQVHGGAMPNRVPAKQPKPSNPKPQTKDGKEGKQGPARPGPAPGEHPLDYWSSLTPEQRKARLEKLPPQRAANIQKRLDRWNEMTPAQKDLARSLNPQTRQVAADHRAWLMQQPPERQEAIVRQTQLLGQMSPEARQAEMNSPTFKHRFDATEREHIKKVISIVPEPGQNVNVE